MPRTDIVRLLWEQPSTGRRGPRPTLTLEAIARAGIEIADADGLAAVTMQRVAAALGVTKMALYRYVPGKAELVALMTDVGIGSPPAAATEPAPWRDRLDIWTRQMFELLWRHPWAMEATVGVRPMGPNELAWMEQVVAALAGTGLDGGEQLDVAVTLSGHVRNIIQQRVPVGRSPDESVESVLVELLREHGDRFPALVGAMRSAVEPPNRAFDFGLARILDGVERLVAERAGNDPARP